MANGYNQKELEALQLQKQLTQRGEGIASPKPESKMDFLQNPLFKGLIGITSGLGSPLLMDMMHKIANKPMAHDNIDTAIEKNDNKDFFDIYGGVNNQLQPPLTDEFLQQPIKDPSLIQSKQPTLFERLIPTIEETRGRGSNLPEAFGNKLLELILGTRTPISGKDEKALQDSISQYTNDLVK